MFRNDEEGGFESAIVLDPTIKMPEGLRLVLVPATVMAGPPAQIVVPAMENAVGLGVKVWPATVSGELVGGVDDGVGSEIVEPATYSQRSRMTETDCCAVDCLCSTVGIDGCAVEHEACWVGGQRTATQL